MNVSDIEKLVNILNERLSGVPLDQLNDKLFKEVIVLLSKHIQNYDILLTFDCRYIKSNTL